MLTITGDMNVRQLLDALGFKSGNHDVDVKSALLRLNRTVEHVDWLSTQYFEAHGSLIVERSTDIDRDRAALLATVNNVRVDVELPVFERPDWWPDPE